MDKIYVIGIGYRPLTEQGRRLVDRAKVILASERLREVFAGYAEYQACQDKVLLINNVEETLAFLADQLAGGGDKLPAVLIASGDPLFFGIGRLALERFGPDRVEILPDLSSIQIAFAGIKEPWDDALLMSLHGGPFPRKRRKLPYGPDDLAQLLLRHPKIAILTDGVNNPAVIARALSKESDVKIYVCQRLGYADESIAVGTPEEIAGKTFAEPNVVIVKRGGELPPGDGGFGLREEEIHHQRGLITKDEVRAVALHKLRLPARGVLWDIGAGSGAIAIEAARLCPGLKVFAVERDEDQAALIRQNTIRHGVANLSLIRGEAPEALMDLPAPDRVFIGGSGGRLPEIITLAAKRGAPLIVVNAATIDTLNDAVAALEGMGYEVDISQISVARARKIAGKRGFTALNPVFVIAGVRPA